MELWTACQYDIRLFGQLPRQRRLQGLAPFDAAAGEEPTRPIGVADQQDPLVRTDYRALGTERKPPSQAPIGLHEL